ncbi:DUF998 domain-containing protein [Mycobacterium sp. CPCC 205372]|uniref:DUF998 domain-containing protein n=1 Tax=Mycobacterium hippophais TaxID=3016340 RepID=A0ABT4PPM9_9MYCO|nr:DUF998 domain-containing protein [Mycobacterium hippophais]MCZ8378511.1 DUF998 domain-containing protein [Mycobacterium hippophais]
MHNRRTGIAAAACWTAGAGGYLLAEAVAAAHHPGYSYAHDAISDLGTPQSPSAVLMNAGFCLQGAMFLLGAVLAVRAVRPSRPAPVLVCAAANAAGNVLVATVHSGAGPWHVVGAVLAIAGGNLTALAAAPMLRPAAVRWASAALGATGLACAAMWVITDRLPGPVLERVSVYTIVCWQVLAAAALLPAWRERAQRTERDGGGG